MTRRCIKLYPSPEGAAVLDDAFNRENAQRRLQGRTALSMSEWVLERLLLGDLARYRTDPAAPRTDHAAANATALQALDALKQAVRKA